MVRDGWSSTITPYGRLHARRAASRFILSAPHGTHDSHTGEIARRVSERLSWNCVVAEGFSPEGTRINLNRPSEGVGLRPWEERRTDRARESYQRYKRALRTLGARPLALYAELHGNSQRKLRGVVEIACAGMAPSEARGIKDAFERALTRRDLPALRVAVEGVDRITLKARAAKEFGVLRDLTPAIHIELPNRLRWQHREELIAFVAGALARISSQRAVSHTHPFK